MLWPSILERALRLAAIAHADQRRKGSDLPYVYHPAAVAMILQRTGFTDPSLLAAAILHDVVEDTDVTIDDLQREFPPEVTQWVADLSEQKSDESGAQRPWRERKEDHLRHVAGASLESRAIVLADKLHNLQSMRDDVAMGRMDWKKFNAPREQIFEVAVRMIQVAAGDDEQLSELKREALGVIDELRVDG